MLFTKNFPRIPNMTLVFFYDIKNSKKLTPKNDFIPFFDIMCYANAENKLFSKFSMCIVFISFSNL